MVLTKEGIAVIEGDTHLSKFIAESGQLDIPVVQELLGQLTPYIPVGGTVVDVGACLGDHTLGYAKMVGPTGRVYAFEPNPPALECLRYNLRDYPQVRIFGAALGDTQRRCRMAPHPGQPQNLGMASVMNGDETDVWRLDDVSRSWPRLDYMKIDVEGFEVGVLKGAARTIARHRPVIIMEVNAPVLALHGCTAEQLYELLQSWDYGFLPVMDPSTDDHLERFAQPEIDVICFPRERFNGPMFELA